MAQRHFDSDKLRIRRPNEPDLAGIGPPFDFPGVSLRVFPLRANMHTLRRFCDGYLNVVPPEIGDFRPALPFVFLVVLDYGRMAVEERNLGWIAQREVTFTVPLEWYRRDGGSDRFVDWAYCTPFIYVDHPMSLLTGREVYGWPKMLCRMSQRRESAFADPRGWQRLLSLDTLTFEERSREEHAVGRRLLEIDYELPPGPATFPPEPWSPFNPLRSLPAALVGAWSLVPELLETWFPTAFRGWAPRDPRSLLDMARRLFRGSWGVSSRPEATILTLKQFPDADQPEKACYQALVRSQMRLDRFTRGGLFGDLKLLQGDPSGGVHVRLYAERAHPILESLGLEIGKERRLGKTAAATLYPVFPFWLELDLGYGRGETLCWRTRDSEWYQGSQLSHPLPPRRGHHQAWYITKGSGAFQALAGTLSFRDASLVFFPLLADGAALRKLVHSYLGLDRVETRFEAWGNVVYLIAARLQGIRAEKSSLGELEARDLVFYVPVKQIWKDKNDGTEKTSWGLMAPFGFGDNPLLGVLHRELLGRPFADSSFTEPPGAWLQVGGHRGVVLNARTNVFSAFGVGMEAEERTVVEICKGEPEGTPLAAWARARAEESRRSEAARPAVENLQQALAEKLSNPHELPISLFTLKQIRDAEEPGRACFQAIVRTDYFLDRLLAEPEWLKEPYHVRIHRYPSQPIVDLLGLQVRLFDGAASLPGGAREGAEIAVLAPCRPFSLRVAMRRKTGKEIFQQANAGPWLEDQTVGFPSADLSLLTQLMPYDVFPAVEIHPQDILDHLLGTRKKEAE